jgi:hypothetical protein
VEREDLKKGVAVIDGPMGLVEELLNFRPWQAEDS